MSAVSSWAGLELGERDDVGPGAPLSVVALVEGRSGEVSIVVDSNGEQSCELDMVVAGCGCCVFDAQKVAGKLSE